MKHVSFYFIVIDVAEADFDEQFNKLHRSSGGQGMQHVSHNYNEIRNALKKKSYAEFAIMLACMHIGCFINKQFLESYALKENKYPPNTVNPL